MCVVSAVTDHYQQKWPVQLPSWPLQPSTPLPIRIISEAEWQEYQDLKRKAAEIDSKTGQPDCVKPGVAEWEAEIEKIVERAVKKLKE